MQRGKTATREYRNIGGEVGESVDLVGEVEYWLLEQREREREIWRNTQHLPKFSQ